MDAALNRSPINKSTTVLKETNRLKCYRGYGPSSYEKNMKLDRYMLFVKLIIAVGIIVGSHEIYRTCGRSTRQVFTQDNFNARELMIDSTRRKTDNIEILFWTTLYGRDMVETTYGVGWDPFTYCPIRACSLTNNRSRLAYAEAVFIDIKQLIEGHQALPIRQSWSQHWLFFYIESPVHFPPELPHPEMLNDKFNLTITYSLSADLPLPYVEYVRRKDVPSAEIREFRVSGTSSTTKVVEDVAETRNSRISASAPTVSEHHSAGRGRMILWIVSSCSPRSQRQLYARELAQYVDIDVFGRCGSQYAWNNLPHKNYACEGDTGSDSSCLATVGKNYKFYFAAENSICDEYVTEKVTKALESGLIPIVLGGADYSRLLPPKSYINIADFTSPKALADHLLKVNASEELYVEYFRWKPYWKRSPRYLVESMMCDMCRTLHERVGSQAGYSRRTVSLEEWYKPDKHCQTPAQYYKGHADYTSWSEGYGP